MTKEKLIQRLPKGVTTQDNTGWYSNHIEFYVELNVDRDNLTPSTPIAKELERQNYVLVNVSKLMDVKNNKSTLTYVWRGYFKPVYIQASNCIGVIIDTGVGNNKEKWYRTDSDGIQYADELLFLKTKKDVKECTKQLNAHIAPSTKKLLGL